MVVTWKMPFSNGDAYGDKMQTVALDNKIFLG
jgi:hypothetical protein